MSLRQLARHCAPLVQLLTGAQSPIATSTSRICVRAESTAASAGERLFGGQTLQEIRHRIFGDHIGNNLSSGRKILRRKLNGDRIASYYGTKGLEQSDPFFVDLDAEA